MHKIKVKMIAYLDSLSTEIFEIAEATKSVVP